MNYQYLNTDQMQALEKHAFENYPITLEQMMQKAGEAVFDLIVNEIMPTLFFIPTGVKRSGGIPRVPRDEKWGVLVVTGKGNNGGDALVAARLLNEKGIKVAVVNIYWPNEFTTMAKAELEKVMDLGIPIYRSLEECKDEDIGLIVDGLFGFSLSGDPRPPVDDLIEQINCSSFDSASSAQDDNLCIPVLAVDVPSGLDVHTGERSAIATIEATYTIALGMLKLGLEKHKALAGKIFVGDLGIPPEAYRHLGYVAPDFKGKSYISVN